MMSTCEASDIYIYRYDSVEYNWNNDLEYVIRDIEFRLKTIERKLGITYGEETEDV